MDKPYSRSKKPDTKGHTLYDFISMKCPEQANLYIEKIDWWFSWDGGDREMGSECSWVWGFFWR